MSQIYKANRAYSIFWVRIILANEIHDWDTQIIHYICGMFSNWYFKYDYGTHVYFIIIMINLNGTSGQYAITRQQIWWLTSITLVSSSCMWRAGKMQHHMHCKYLDTLSHHSVFISLKYSNHSVEEKNGIPWKPNIWALITPGTRLNIL